MTAGFANLGRHIENMQGFGVPEVVAIIHFDGDTAAKVACVQDFVSTCGTTAMLCRLWAEGSAGITDLAQRVVELADSGAVAVIPLYPDDMGLAEKFDTVAGRICRADRGVMDARVCMQLVEWEAQGFGDLPVCMVKTPYSSTTDPDVKGVPTGCDVPVREVRLSAGAGFVVAILIGADPASEVYVRSKGKMTKAVGMLSLDYRLPVEAAGAEVLGLVADLNANPAVHGILVELPLPGCMDESRILAAINPAMDVDGFHISNVGLLATGAAGVGALRHSAV